MFYCVLCEVGGRPPVLVHHHPRGTPAHYSREFVGTKDKARRLATKLAKDNAEFPVVYTLCQLSPV